MRLKCITHTSVTVELLYYCKNVSTFKEVQLVQTQHHGAKLHKRATYGQKVQYTYISQNQSFYKIELRYATVL